MFTTVFFVFLGNLNYWKYFEVQYFDRCHRVYTCLTLYNLTIASKINGTPRVVCLPISKQHSILAVVNLLAHNNKSQICYCGQISLQSAAVNCSFSDTLGGNINFAGDGTLSRSQDLTLKNFMFPKLEYLLNKETELSFI